MYGPAFEAWLDVRLLSVADDWLCRLPRQYRQRSVRLDQLTQGEGQFVKPASFRAQTFDAGIYVEELPAAAIGAPVLVSEPVDWEIEFRCFVLNRAVVAQCMYYRGGQLNRDAEGSWPCTPDEERAATEFATALLADRAVELPNAVVIDIGRIRARGWAVVEANPAWCSGIYGCDPAAVLKVLEEAVIKTPGRNGMMTHHGAKP
jgi:hypothetical protein